METDGGVDVEFQTNRISVPDGDHWPASSPKEFLYISVGPGATVEYQTALPR
jgi:hypothetical protein